MAPVNLQSLRAGKGRVCDENHAKNTNNTKLVVAGTVRLETGERICWMGINGRGWLYESSGWMEGSRRRGRAL